MPRVAKLDPKELPNGTWELNIPASLSDTGKRRRVSFETKGLAQAEADKIQRERKQWGIRAKHAEPHLVTEATAAAELLQPYGVGLLEAVRQWIANRDRLNASETVAEACRHFEQLKEDEGRSVAYMRSIRQLAKNLPSSFMARPVADLEPAKVEAALEEISNGASMWNLKRRELHAVFAESVRRGKAESNPVARALVKKQAKGSRIDILTLDETKALLAACKGKIPNPRLKNCKIDLADALPAVAVALFAGLRPEELKRVDWKQIDLEEGVIRLDSDDTKTRRRRHVDISDNLAAWLKPHAKSEGRLVPTCWPDKWRILRAKVGISERVDITRHTFGTAWWAIHRDIHQLSFQMGNSPEVCRKHYVEHMPRRDALNYWAIAPKGAKLPTAKVV